jgi:hypothetical protein
VQWQLIESTTLQFLCEHRVWYRWPVQRRVLFLLPVLLALATPAAADWNRNQRGQFSADCTAACQENPKMNGARRSQCAAYCGCLMGEAEKFISEEEYGRLDMLREAGGSHPTLDRLRSLAPVCSRRAFGE